MRILLGIKPTTICLYIIITIIPRCLVLANGVRGRLAPRSSNPPSHRSQRGYSHLQDIEQDDALRSASLTEHAPRRREHPRRLGLEETGSRWPIGRNRAPKEKGLSSRRNTAITLPNPKQDVYYTYVKDVPRDKWKDVFDAEAVRIVNQVPADEPDDEDLEAYEAALHHMDEMRHCPTARCKEPQPFIQLMHDPFKPTRVFLPRFTLLYRCMNYTGFCGDHSRECVPKHTTIIHRAFIVQDILPGQEAMTLDPSAATMIPLLNHTECECQQKARLKPCTKVCPVPFRRIRRGHDCLCDCFPIAHEDHPQCEYVKHGVLPLSVDGLVCIKRSDCYSPICIVGEFDVRKGYCPLSDDYALGAHLYHNPEDRRHDRSHLKNYNIAELGVTVSAYPHHNYKAMVRSRHISDREKKRRILESTVEGLRKAKMKFKSPALTTKIPSVTKHSVAKIDGDLNSTNTKTLSKPEVATTITTTTTPSRLGIMKKSQKRKKRRKRIRHPGSFTGLDFLWRKSRYKKPHYYHQRSHRESKPKHSTRTWKTKSPPKTPKRHSSPRTRSTKDAVKNLEAKSVIKTPKRNIDKVNHEKDLSNRHLNSKTITEQPEIGLYSWIPIFDAENGTQNNASASLVDVSNSSSLQTTSSYPFSSLSPSISNPDDGTTITPPLPTSKVIDTSPPAPPPVRVTQSTTSVSHENVTPEVIGHFSTSSSTQHHTPSKQDNTSTTSYITKIATANETISKTSTPSNTAIDRLESKGDALIGGSKEEFWESEERLLSDESMYAEGSGYDDEI